MRTMQSRTDGRAARTTGARSGRCALRGRGTLAAAALLTGGCMSADLPVAAPVFLSPPDQTYQVVPPSQAWVAAHSSLVTVERGVGIFGEREQRVALPNPTALPGENELILFAVGQGTQSAGRLQFDLLRRKLGGFPAPFDDVSERGFVAASDSLGSYLWVATSYGSTTTCVLALRRVDADDRLIPEGRNALDMVLRNCVRGDATEALQPIMDTTIAQGRAIAAPGPTGSRMLSPLAAPLPD